MWTTVNDISSSILYGVSESAKANGAYKLLRITDIQENQVNWNTVPFTDYDEAKANAYLLQNGDIVFARTGATVGKSYLVKDLVQKAIYASYLIRVQIFNTVLPQYVKLFFESNYYWEQIELNSVGIGQPNVNGTILGNLKIPIPPIKEQQRIVAEIKKWLTLIDIIETGKTDLQNAIKQAKSKILDLAIHGKLVPQNPNDEPASEQLKRISPKAEITCDNAHSRKLPQGWCCCPLENLFTITMGQSPSGDSINQKDGIEFHQGKIQFTEKYLSRSLFFTNTPTKMAVPNSILLCVRAPVGVINITKRQICIGRGLCSLHPISILNLDFAFYSLLTYKSQLDVKSTGTTFKAISVDIIKKELFYLPPYQEQQRIVQKIEELFSLLNDIQETLEA